MTASLRRRPPLVAATLALLLPVPVAASPDRTEDVALVATLLAKLKLKDLTGASRLLSPGAILADVQSGATRTLANFGAYARGCPLKRVYTVTDRQADDRGRLPLGAEWSCPYPRKAHSASFWIGQGRIRRIVHGPQRVITIAPPPRLPPELR